MSSGTPAPPPVALRPMSEFNPAQPAILHERTSNAIIPWTGEMRDAWMQSATRNADGSITWNEQVFDGWGNVLGG